MTFSVSSWCIEIATPAICVFTIARAAHILFFEKNNVNKKIRSARGGFEFLPFFASAMGRCFCMARCFSKGSASAWQRHVLRSACLLVLPSSCDPVWDFKKLRFLHPRRLCATRHEDWPKQGSTFCHGTPAPR